MPPVGRVSKEARRAGLFLLVAANRWEFFSASSGKYLLCWFADSRRWTTPNDSGRAFSPFGALHQAVAEDKRLGRLDAHPFSEGVR